MIIKNIYIKTVFLFVFFTTISQMLAQGVQVNSIVIEEQVSSSGLKHPGCLQSAAEINALSLALSENDPTRMSYWDSMITNSRGLIDNTDWVAKENLFGKIDLRPAKLAGAGLIRYVNDWVINNNTASETAAITILNNWAAIKSFTPNPKDNNENHRLEGGQYLGYIAHAADLLMSTNTSWPALEQETFKKTFRSIILPIINEDRPVSFNANWDLACTWSVMAIAILLDDKALFDEQIEWLKNGESNARISYCLLQSGQYQETARDQTHVAMGLTHLQLATQIAWTQGVDLYEYDNRSVGKSLDYFAAYNLGENNLPFQIYPCAVGANTEHDYNQQISPSQSPNYDHIFEMVYHHYKNYRGIELPHVKQMLEEHTRPEGPGRRWSTHNSALFWDLDLSADAQIRNAKAADISLDLNPIYSEQIFMHLNAGMVHYGALDGVAFTKRAESKELGFVGGTNASLFNPIENTEDDLIYQTYRLGPSAYNIAYPNGEYTVFLHFAETSYNTSGARVFDVTIENNTILDNFDIYETAGSNTAFVFETQVNITDGEMNIGFSAITDQPLINAIEVVPTLDPNLGLDSETANRTLLSVYPIPAKDWIHIKMPGLKNKLVSIISISGTVIVKNMTSDSDILDFNTSLLKSGIYLVTVQDKFSNEISVKKLVII